MLLPLTKCFSAEIIIFNLDHIRKIKSTYFLGGNTVNIYVNLQSKSMITRHYSNSRQHNQYPSQICNSRPTSSSNKLQTALRKTNAECSLLKKKHVIKMLIAVVLEFFICWTPLYIINTIVLFDSSIIYNYLGYTGISFFQLLAFTSSCCNPITYCFMNRGFRKSFVHLFRCCNCFHSSNRALNGSDFNMTATKFSSKVSEPSDLN